MKRPFISLFLLTVFVLSGYGVSYAKTLPVYLEIFCNDQNLRNQIQISASGELKSLEGVELKSDSRESDYCLSFCAIEGDNDLVAYSYAWGTIDHYPSGEDFHYVSHSVAVGEKKDLEKSISYTVLDFDELFLHYVRSIDLTTTPEGGK